MCNKKTNCFVGILFVMFLLMAGCFKTDVCAAGKMSGTVWIAGDSIAADHSYENEANYAEFVHGWGEVIGNYFTDEAIIHNKAISGQSAKYFVLENNYKEIMEGIGEGDLLLIQFGHNDYKSDGSNHYSLPTSTEGSYKWYLKNYYIDPALKAGAIPVLCTSVVCCEFVDGIVKENQPQSLFAGAMRELQAEYKEQGIDIGLIDTYQLTQSMLNCYNFAASSFYALKYDKDGVGTSLDHVHFSMRGATMTADMIAENLFVMYPDFNRYNIQNITDGGEGTKENPYLISSYSQLYRILQDENLNKKGTCFKITKDMDPVIQNKDVETVFYGNLDGGSHIIKNVTGRGTKSLFDVNYGVISNFVFEYANNHTCNSIQYPLVNENYGTIENCSSKGSIWYDYFLGNSKEWYCGGFAAVNHKDGVIRNCTNDTEITVNTDIPKVYLGGIAGLNYGDILNCENTGRLKIDLTEYKPDSKNVHDKVYCVSGGIAGASLGGGQITDCKASLLPVVMSTLKGEKSYLLNDCYYVDEEAFNVTSMIKGDVDNDQKVTLKDASQSLKLALGIIEAEDEDIPCLDFDNDNKVTLKDVTYILKTALGILKTEELF